MTTDQHDPDNLGQLRLGRRSLRLLPVLERRRVQIGARLRRRSLPRFMLPAAGPRLARFAQRIAAGYAATSRHSPSDEPAVVAPRTYAPLALPAFQAGGAAMPSTPAAAMPSVRQPDARPPLRPQAEKRRRPELHKRADAAPSRTDDLERSSPLVLDQHIVSLLSRIMQQPLPAVKIYANHIADRLTRAAGADALAYPDRILFRSGAYDPQRPVGLALLSHELTHVAAMRTQLQGARLPDRAAHAAEERTALQNESAGLQPFAQNDPQRPTGLALLSHAAMRTQLQGARLPDRAAHAAEERTALQNEGAVLRYFAQAEEAAPQAQPPAPVRPAADATLSAPSYRPMAPDDGSRSLPRPAGVPSAPPMVPRAARSDRDPGPLPAPPAAGISDAQLREIKDTIYHDLIDRIRTEFERGG